MTQLLTKTHYPQLDGLRGWAIILVMAYHFGLEHRAHANPGFLLDLSQIGWAGVDVFFVLSGFLITTILVETKNSTGYIKNFLARRFLRIWPLYYACLILFFIILPIFATTLPEGLESMRDKQIWFWTYLANWLFTLEGGFNQTSGGYFWSLAVEEQFYLVWPFVVLFVSEAKLLRIAFLLLTGSLSLRLILLVAGFAPGALYTNTFTHLDGLAVGACIAVCWRNVAWRESIKELARYILPFSLLGLLIVRWIDGSWVFWTIGMASFGYTLIALAAGAVLIFALNCDDTKFWRFFAINKPLIVSGKFSYALYLVHVPVATICQVALTRTGLWNDYPYPLVFTAFILIAFLLSYVAAYLSWHLFEKRILSLKRYFKYQESAT